MVNVMDILLWVLAFFAGLIVAAAAIPVRYVLSLGSRGVSAEIRLLAGLWKKKWVYSFSSGQEGCGEDKKDSMPDENGSACMRSGQPEDFGFCDIDTLEPHESPGKSSFTEIRENTKADSDSGPGRPADEPSWSDVARKAVDNGAARRLWRGAGKLWHHTRPREAEVSGEAGLGDPMYTGILQGWAETAFPPLQNLRWNYFESCFRAELTVRGRIIPLYAAIVAAHVALSPPVRELWTYKKHGEGGK
jgi:hypothetical protein